MLVKRAMIVILVFTMLLLAGCSIKHSKEELLGSMVEKVSRINSYQLEAELEVDGARFLIRQWFSAPDRLRTTVTQGSGLEQIVVSAEGNTYVYYSATGKWVLLPDPDSGPFPWGQPILLFLAEIAKNEVAITETFSSIKVSAHGLLGWERCEIVISQKSGLPESCTLTRGNHLVNLQILSLVVNLKYSEDLFLPGQ